MHKVDVKFKSGIFIIKIKIKGTLKSTQKGHNSMWAKRLIPGSSFMLAQ